MEVIKSYVCPKFPKSAWSAVEIVVAVVLTRLVHTHMATTNLLQMISVGQGTTATTISTALHADLGNFGHT